MASTSAVSAAAATTMTLTPVMTLRGHEEDIPSISYFPGGERMISGSDDRTTRQWDVRVGKEIGKSRDVCQRQVRAVAVSRDGRWVVTAGGHSGRGELKAWEVETGIVKKFEGHSQQTYYCIDISADGTLLVSGALDDYSARIWSLDTGKLVAGPLKSDHWPGAVRFSQDSKKFAMISNVGKCLEVWDVRAQKLEVKVGKFGYDPMTYAPVFWTNKNRTIIAAFSFTDDPPTAIYEFNATTLETVGVPFEGHTMVIASLALSSHGSLLVSACYETIKLWAFESRQLLASFEVLPTNCLILSPDSRQLAYTTGSDIYICNTPIEILNSTSAHVNPSLGDLLNVRISFFYPLRIDPSSPLQSDATRRPNAVRRNLATSPIMPSPPRSRRLLPTVDPQQPVFDRHLRKFLHLPSRTNTAPPVRPRDPLDFSATSALPPNPSPLAQATTRFDGTSPPRRSNGLTQLLRQHLSLHRSSHQPPAVEVAAGRKFTRLAAANLPEYRKVDDTRHPSRRHPSTGNDPPSESSDIDSLPDVHWCKAFFCYYSCWSHRRLRMPPRWRLERVYPLRQAGTTSSSAGGVHSGS